MRDITWRLSPIKGKYYYLYLILDLFSRKIVAWDIWEEESAELASELVRRAVLSERLTKNNPLVLQSDNGSPMKGAILLELLYKLGITPSRGRPRVSNDNPYAESHVRTAQAILPRASKTWMQPPPMGPRIRPLVQLPA